MPRRQPSKQNISQKATSEDAKCLFCFRGPDHDNVAVGPVYSKDGVFAHKNCLYFGAGLVQTENVDTENVDTENEGADELFFFPIDAIKKEARRSSKLKCKFCKLPNASAGCLNKRCKKQFHFPCGLENGVMFNYHDFTSSCPEHQERQEPNTATVELICHICQDEIEPIATFDQIYCPSCKKWLHRGCAQNWAYKAGVHHLRCPMCNNGQQFIDELYRLGFDLPDRDAEWEREGMYREQEQGTFLRCSAETCVCKGGRDYSAKKGMQELIACVVCGEFAIHRQCIDNDSLSFSDGSVDIWWCDVCEKVELKLEAQRQIEEIYKERVASKSTAFFTQNQHQQQEEALAIDWNDDEELGKYLRFEIKTMCSGAKKPRTSVEPQPSSPVQTSPAKPPPIASSSSGKKSDSFLSPSSKASSSKPPTQPVAKPASEKKKNENHFLSPKNLSSNPPQKRSVSTSKKGSRFTTSSTSTSADIKSPPPYAARVIPGSNIDSKKLFPLFEPRKPTSASKVNENPEKSANTKPALGQSSNRLSPPLLLPIPVPVQTLLLD